MPKKDSKDLKKHGFNKLLSAINNVTEAIGPLGTIGLGAGLFAGFNNIDKTYKHTVSNHLLNCVV